jgi:hypothetical protein
MTVLCTRRRGGNRDTAAESRIQPRETPAARGHERPTAHQSPKQATHRTLALRALQRVHRQQRIVVNRQPIITAACIPLADRPLPPGSARPTSHAFAAESPDLWV